MSFCRVLVSNFLLMLKDALETVIMLLYGKRPQNFDSVYFHSKKHDDRDVLSPVLFSTVETSKTLDPAKLFEHPRYISRQSQKGPDPGPTNSRKLARQGPPVLGKKAVEMHIGGWGGIVSLTFFLTIGGTCAIILLG